mmetsp:Transcript_3000/g.10774  ORF Transcript_3000/g.10774 Transcript_3000/m.10774 type:complete len:305 (-) Transcript_3000:2256-3170(-)
MWWLSSDDIAVWPLEAPTALTRPALPRSFFAARSTLRDSWNASHVVVPPPPYLLTTGSPEPPNQSSTSVTSSRPHRQMPQHLRQPPPSERSQLFQQDSRSRRVTRCPRQLRLRSPSSSLLSLRLLVAMHSSISTPKPHTPPTMIDSTLTVQHPPSPSEFSHSTNTSSNVSGSLATCPSPPPDADALPPLDPSAPSSICVGSAASCTVVPGATTPAATSAPATSSLPSSAVTAAARATASSPGRMSTVNGTMASVRRRAPPRAPADAPRSSRSTLLRLRALRTMPCCRTVATSRASAAATARRNS